MEAASLVLYVLHGEYLQCLESQIFDTKTPTQDKAQ